MLDVWPPFWVFGQSVRGIILQPTDGFFFDSFLTTVFAVWLEDEMGTFRTPPVWGLRCTGAEGSEWPYSIARTYGFLS